MVEQDFKVEALRIEPALKSRSKLSSEVVYSWRSTLVIMYLDSGDLVVGDRLAV